MLHTSSLPIRGIRSCGIEAPSNLAPHLEQLHLYMHMMYLTTMQAKANHIKTNSIGVQLQAVCWYEANEQEELPQA